MTTTRENITEIIRETANKHGFEFEQTGFGMTIRDGFNHMESWVNFNIFEKHEWKMDAKEIKVSFTFRASVSRMGGNTTADDLLKASETIKRASELIRELEEMDLAYIQKFDD